MTPSSNEVCKVQEPEIESILYQLSKEIDTTFIHSNSIANKSHKIKQFPETKEDNNLKHSQNSIIEKLLYEIDRLNMANSILAKVDNHLYQIIG